MLYSLIFKRVIIKKELRRSLQVEHAIPYLPPERSFPLSLAVEAESPVAEPRILLEVVQIQEGSAKTVDDFGILVSCIYPVPTLSSSDLSYNLYL